MGGVKETNEVKYIYKIIWIYDAGYYTSTCFVLFHQVFF